MPEHLADDVDEARLVRRRDRPRPIRRAERTPIDLFVNEVRILAIERVPQRVELRREIRRWR